MFPPADSDFHDYAEMVVEINQAAADHLDIVDVLSLGQSYEGRGIWAIKFSDNPTLDESEPEVLLTFHQQSGRLFMPHCPLQPDSTPEFHLRPSIHQRFALLDWQD